MNPESILRREDMTLFVPSPNTLDTVHAEAVHDWIVERGDLIELDWPQGDCR